MHSLVIALALSQAPPAPSTAGEPVWFTVYGQAWQHGHEGHKPLAVFIGAGATGWEQLAEEGQLGKDVLKVLSTRYVCVYLDTEKPESRLVARRLDVPAGPALIVSSPGAAFQAFRHVGALCEEDLMFFLERFADPRRPVRSTASTFQLTESVEQDAEPVRDPQGRAPEPMWSSSSAGRMC
jgi:hypothetical protein